LPPQAARSGVPREGPLRDRTAYASNRVTEGVASSLVGEPCPSQEGMEPAASTTPGHTLAVCRWHPLDEWPSGRWQPLPYSRKGSRAARLSPAILPRVKALTGVPTASRAGERRQRTWRITAHLHPKGRSCQPCVHGRGPDRGPARPGESLAGGCPPAASPARAPARDGRRRSSPTWWRVERAPGHSSRKGGRPGGWRSVRPDRGRRRWRSKGRQVDDADPWAGDGTLATVCHTRLSASSAGRPQIGSIGLWLPGGIVTVR